MTLPLQHRGFVSLIERLTLAAGRKPNNVVTLPRTMQFDAPQIAEMALRELEGAATMLEVNYPSMARTHRRFVQRMREQLKRIEQV